MAKELHSIKIEPEQWAQFQRAAKAADKSVSEWLRDLGAAAVSGGVIRAAQHPVEVHPQPREDYEVTTEAPKQYAAPSSELTRSLNTLLRGTEWEREPEPAQSWLPRVQEWARNYEGEGGNKNEVNEDIRAATGGAEIPRGHLNWWMDARRQRDFAEWLDTRYPRG